MAWVISHLREIIHLHPNAIQQHIHGNPNAEGELGKHYHRYNATPLLPEYFQRHLRSAQNPFVTTRKVKHLKLDTWSDHHDAVIAVHEMQPIEAFQWSLTLSPHIVPPGRSEWGAALTHALYNQEYARELLGKKPSKQIARYLQLNMNITIKNLNQHPKWKYHDDARFVLALQAGRWDGYKYDRTHKRYGADYCHMCKSTSDRLTRGHLFVCPALHEDRMRTITCLMQYLQIKKIDITKIAFKTRKEECKIERIARSLSAAYQVDPNWYHTLVSPLTPTSIVFRHEYGGLNHRRALEVMKWMTREQLITWIEEEKKKIDLSPLLKSPDPDAKHQYQAICATYTTQFCELLRSEQYALKQRGVLAWLLYTDPTPEQTDLIFRSFTDSDQLASELAPTAHGALYWEIMSFINTDYLHRIRARISSPPQH